MVVEAAVVAVTAVLMAEAQLPDASGCSNLDAAPANGRISEDSTAAAAAFPVRNENGEASTESAVLGRALCNPTAEDDRGSGEAEAADEGNEKENGRNAEGDVETGGGEAAGVSRKWNFEKSSAAVVVEECCANATGGQSTEGLSRSSTA